MQHSRSSSHWSRWTARLAMLVGVPALLLAGCDLAGGSSTSATTSSAACSAHYVAPPLTSSGGLATAVTNSGGNVPDSQAIQLNIALNVDYADLEKCTASIYDPHSSDYGHYLSPQDIATRFSPPQSDVQKLTSFLTSNGLQVTQTFDTGAALSVTGTAAQVNKAFNIQLVYSANKKYYGPNQSPALPSDVQGIVASINGLNTQGALNCNIDNPKDPNNCTIALQHYSHFTLPKNLPAKAKAVPQDGDCTLAQIGIQIPGLTGSGINPLVTWSDVKSFYGLDNLSSQGFDGSGTTIGMVEFDTYSVPDVANYMTCAGTKPARALDRLPVVNVDVKSSDTPAYSEDGSTPGAGEATLDMEMAAGMTSAKTNIVDYYAPNNDQWETELLDILHKVAADKKVTVLSISYGDFEGDLSPTYMESVNDAMKLLASEGISVFVASGDCAAFASGQFGSRQLSFPASAPYAIAVGGTTLAPAITSPNHTETTWLNNSPDKTTCQNTWGSGGGLSTEPTFTLPAWQKATTAPGFSNTQSNGQRQVPDVSASAINISFYYSGLWLPVGGTSAAAPIWASGIDVVNQALAAKSKAPFGGPQTIYTLANGSNASKTYFDITQGNYPNLYPFQATKGWDFVTGWGSPEFDQIAAALNQ